jgi:hypothetical protein
VIGGGDIPRANGRGSMGEAFWDWRKTRGSKSRPYCKLAWTPVAGPGEGYFVQAQREGKKETSPAGP